MKILKLSRFGWIPVSITALLLSPALSQRARAFGGFWSSQSAPVKQSAAQILFVDNPDSTVTAVVRIQYAGPAQKFAWLIPLPGTPRVGISSNALFERLDAVTAPQYLMEVGLDSSCTQNGDAGVALDGGYATDPTPPRGISTAPIAVLAEGSLGPYDYVDIAVDSSLSDPVQAATDWLSMNGYDLTDLDSQVLGPYLQAGLNLLAFKLQSDADAGAIRPVTLTYDSKQLIIPIRATAVAAQENMDLQVWVIGPSQAVPDNYPSLVVNDALFDWSSGRSYAAGTLPAGGAGPSNPYVSRPSNYAAIVSAAVNEAGGSGFLTELAAPASLYRDDVWSAMDDQEFTTVTGQSYADGIDAIFAAYGDYGSWDGWNDAVAGATTLPKGVSISDFANHPDQYRSTAKVDIDKFFQLLRDDVIQPFSDSAMLLYNAPYLTRLYTTLSADQMSLDPSFDFNPDLAQISNIHIAKQSLTCSAPDQTDGWRIDLPQGGVVTGQAGSDWPIAVGSMPANLKIVTLSTSGSGAIVKDNGAEIEMKLSTAAVSGDYSAAPPPQNGLTIGGSETLPTPLADAGASSSAQSSHGRCSVVRIGGRDDAGWAAWSVVAISLCRRRRRLQRMAAGK